MKMFIAKYKNQRRLIAGNTAANETPFSYRSFALRSSQTTSLFGNQYIMIRKNNYREQYINIFKED